MTVKAQKTTPNTALKVAIVSSGKRQVDIADRCGIEEVQLSKIVTGRVPASDKEKRRLCRVLGKTDVELFGAAGSEASTS